MRYRTAALALGVSVGCTQSSETDGPEDGRTNRQSEGRLVPGTESAAAPPVARRGWPRAMAQLFSCPGVAWPAVACRAPAHRGQRFKRVALLVQQQSLVLGLGQNSGSARVRLRPLGVFSSSLVQRSTARVVWV